jgi:hypothetical protein
MPIGTDLSVDALGNIRYIGAAHALTGAGYYTVLELHRWLQDLADDASAIGNDLVDITSATPSDRSTDNIITLLGIYNIDQVTSEHLYGGSIIQGAAGTDIWDGILVYANPGMDLQIQQNGAMVASAFWNSIPFGTALKGLNPNAANGISHQFVIKTRTAGVDIDLRKLICQTRVWGKTYGEFKINGTSRGNNVAALTYADDLNNVTAVGTVALWTTIANTAGYNLIDVNNDTVTEPYYSQWTRSTYTINQFYERIKQQQVQGSVATLYGLAGEVFRGITHEVTVTTPRVGSIASSALATWTGGTGQVLAVDVAATATKLWIQLLTGVAPTASQLITVGAASVTAGTGTPSLERVLSFPACGVSTGSSLIGAYGFGMVKTDLGASDKVFDLTATLRQAPNYVTFILGNLVAGDQVIVANNLAGDINFAQLTTTAVAINGAAVTSIPVTTAIPADTPATGTIRVKRTSGVYTRHAYTAWAGSAFTIGSTSFAADPVAVSSSVFVSYIDGAAVGATMQFTSIYAADRTLFFKVRNGTTGVPKIKTSSGTATLGAAGGSTNATRISDE